MNKIDLRLIGYIGTILGAVFLILGVATAVYWEVRGLLIHYVVYPYAAYSGPLIIAGIVLLVIGLAFLWRAQQEP